MNPRRPAPPKDMASSAPFVCIQQPETEEVVFEFPEFTPPPQPNTAYLALRVVVRQYCSAAQARTFTDKVLYLQLGRFRALCNAISEYNKGIATNSSAFKLFWRRRTLDHLSGFGFQVGGAQFTISVPGLEDLIKKVEELHKVEIDAAAEAIKAGLIIFDGLAELYRPGTPVLGHTGALGGTRGVFLVAECFYEERRSLVGLERSFHLVLEFVVSLGEHFSLVRFSEVFGGWSGVRARPLSEQIYRPLEASEREAVLARSAKFVTFGGGGARFLSYAPNTFFIHSAPHGAAGSLARSGSSLLPSGGRVMVDTTRATSLNHYAAHSVDEPSLAMIQHAGRYRRWRNAQAAGGGSGTQGGGAPQEALFVWDTVPDDLLLYCWPALVGFSFTAKAWGHVLVHGLDAIRFEEQAFDRLVLSPDRKQLIRALVRFGGEHNTDDIVGGKRGGCVFLLHGPPGVGKTVTAEAIAELLHRPLYYVTMGELGMTPDELERRLSDVLDLCAGWNAIALLDEADVFLEQRVATDLVRNAMVCVMLRLLEYHPGILFLTTNRVRKFDPAFESRVTVALRYEPLSADARAQVWRNLLQRVSGVEVAADLQFEKLARHELNGRQIKNSVRLAVALARECHSGLTQAILDTTLRITHLGQQEMKTDDSWKE